MSRSPQSILGRAEGVMPAAVCFASINPRPLMLLLAPHPAAMRDEVESPFLWPYV
jgi:hypothetical protein